MSTLIGTLHFHGSPRLRHPGDLDVHVFDDAMVLIQGLPPREALPTGRSRTEACSVSRSPLPAETGCTHINASKPRQHAA